MKKILLAGLLGLSAATGPEPLLPAADARPTAPANLRYEVRYTYKNSKVKSAGTYTSEAQARRRMHQINENPDYRAWVYTHRR